MSRSSGPWVTDRNRAMSETVRASGPKWESWSNWLGRMVNGMRPKDGLRPAMPQNEAGMRTEPPMSEPSATATQPDATAAPAPPEDPPDVLAGFQGLRVMPQSGLSVKLE